MNILVINAGSSTLKCQLVDANKKASLMKALAEHIGSPDAVLTISGHKQISIKNASIDTALEHILEYLNDGQDSPIHSLSDINAIGHRIVSGGEYFTESGLVDEEVIRKVELCSELAPLHNPNAVICIRACQKLFPRIPQALVFDTTFHHTMPPKAYMYPLPMRYYTDYAIRRYGAHGTSHRYAAQQAANLIGRRITDLGIITCHLGNGGSIAAVSNGKSVDTTMGFTPLEGLMMGTRSGSIDPAIVTYIMRKENLSYKQMDDVLNRQSGLLGISGISSDMRTIIDAAHQGNKNAELAIDMYAYAVQKAIGAYFAVLNRVDAVVMTAGIGENSAELREIIFDRLAHLGMILDRQKNNMTSDLGSDRIVSIDDSPIKICIVTTDEELRIARETAALIESLNK